MRKIKNEYTFIIFKDIVDVLEQENLCKKVETNELIKTMISFIGQQKFVPTVNRIFKILKTNRKNEQPNSYDNNNNVIISDKKTESSSALSCKSKSKSVIDDSQDAKISTTETKIPELQMCLNENGQFPCKIHRILSLDEFYVMPLHPKYDFENMENQIDEFYKKNEEKMKIKSNTRKRHAFIVKIAKKYYRAVNAKEEKTRLVKNNMYLVDYGGYHTISDNDMYLIHADFCVFPPRVLKCSLDNLLPNDTGPKWSGKVIRYFQKETEKYQQFCISMLYQNGNSSM